MKDSKGIMMGIISSVSFGMIPMFTIPLMTVGMNVSSIVFYRMLFAATLMGSVLLLKKGEFKISLKQLGSLIWTGCICYAGTALTLCHSYEYLPSGVATSIHFLYPVAVVMIMILFFNEKISLQIIISLILSLFGVFLLGYQGDQDAINPVGLAFVLTSVMTYAVYIVSLNNSILKEINGSTLTFYVLLLSAAIFGIYNQFKGGISPIPDFKSFLNFLMLGLICTVISNFTLIYAVKNIGETYSAVLGTMEPITAVIVGVLFFEEAMTTPIILGVMLILISVMLIIYSRSKHRNS